MGEYALGNREDEARRLLRQAEYLAPHTRRTLEAAGVGPGKRVLDLGMGMGDVSLIAAELGASVVGVERDPQTVERARARLAGRPIEVLHGDVQQLGELLPFDVICGRLVLMYLPDPAATLRTLADRLLAREGAVAFVEYDMRAATALQSPALFRANLEAMCRLFEGLGCHADLGLRLPSLFAAAGFGEVAVEAHLWTSSRSTDLPPDMMTAVFRSLAPMAAKHGLEHLVDPDLETLPERLRAAIRSEGVGIGPLVVGAAARRDVR